MNPGQNWRDWLDEKLWDLRRGARDAWWRARTEWYRGLDSLDDLITRRAPERIRTLGDLLRTTERNYDTFIREVPAGAGTIRDMVHRLEEQGTRPRRVRPKAKQ